MTLHTLRGRSILQLIVQVVIIGIAITWTQVEVGRDLDELRESFRETLISKSVLLGQSRESDLSSSLTFYSLEQGNKFLANMVQDSNTDISFAVVLGPDGSPIMADKPARMSQEYPLTEEEKGLQRGEHAMAAKAYRDRETKELTFQVTMPIVDEQTGQSQGYLVMGIPQSAIDAKMVAAESVQAQVSFWLWGLLIFMFALGVFGYFMLEQIFVKPVASLQGSAEIIASGDLSADVDETIRLKRDEVGVLAQSFHEMSQSIRRVVRSIQDSLGMVISSSGAISESSRRVATASQSQSESVGRTFQSMEEIGLAIGRIAENIDMLAASSEESSSSILELNAIIDEISDNVEHLATAVEDTTSSISQMTSSIHQVKDNVEQLSVAADETATSIAEMDASIKQVEANAERTADLAAGFADDAAVGLDAVTRTVESIQNIQTSSREAATVMESLGARVEEIGKILNVIDDVAEQTNLLALNAAIIAAQAGQHGKSFAVVADEIKDLAERTAASTAEIATIIKSVQAESKRAISSVFGSTRLVEEGVGRSQQAGDILRRIADSSQTATTMVREIARATQEQTRGSAQITAAIDKIVNMVLQINVATTEQAKGSTQIMSAAQRMKEITILVRGATREQSKGAKQINEAMDRVIQMVDYINGAIKEQRGGSSQVVNEMEAIKQTMHQNVEAASSMDRAVENLQQQSEALKKEVQRFSL